ncbi:MAG: O-methyltransferase [Candidatus Methylomirabilales bacterium]
MLPILPHEIETYLYRWVPDRDAILQEMESLAEARHFPIVGPIVGHFLAQLARLIGAQRILELGAGFGYSTYWFARALPAEGRVDAIERSADNAQLGQEWLRRAGLAHKVKFILGDALQLIQGLDGPFDLIFVDVDKEQYPISLPLTLPRLRRGGLLVTDNMLWSGRVVVPNPSEPSTRAIQKYTRLLYETPNLHTTLLPLRDGLSVSLKLS